MESLSPQMTYYISSVYDNPLTRGLASGVVSVLNTTATMVKPPPMVKEEIQLWKLVEKNHGYIRLAGLAGASAVILGAYGAHAFNKKTQNEDLKVAFDTANRYHFIHTFPLLAVPLLRRPHLVGALLIAGTSVFCGSCYVYAFTGNPNIRKFTPYGGALLIFAWLSMLF
ncbi:hypothetical protein J437_LFUL002476 [Ladona fulva]|uniref:Transmembrane protein 256 homolog n=1 Tax=Ladona fulva TaxID=123851 RepID=A0A8K0NUB6_LADFU|nr:hypothetical protein J437_LFUL002476 [Ladona fulva]